MEEREGVTTEEEAKSTQDFDEKLKKRADFCLNKCPVCKAGRNKGKGFMYQMTKLESKLGVCIWCNAYKKVYGVPAYEKPPQS
jgi:hypothetical protein